MAGNDSVPGIGPDAAKALVERGNALRTAQRPADALVAYDRALALRPDYAEALNHRGNAMRELRRPADALASYDRALALEPDYAAVHYNRANVLLELQRPADALASLDRALALEPDDAEALTVRGNALVDLKRPADALASYERALALAPDFVAGHYNRGNVLVELERYDDALASYDRAVALDPDGAGAHYNESLCRLLIGDFEVGWRKYEWRWRTEQFEPLKRDFEQPLWLGQQPIAGKTVLLHAEQGIGDTLQFCRYAERVAALGAAVVMEVQPPLRSLLSSLRGVSQLAVRGKPLPRFDYHCPLLSLPLAFQTTLASAPAEVPYLHSDPSRVRQWRERLGATTQPRVGLAWAGRAGQGNDQNRSIPLADFVGLVSRGAQFVSLQKELRPGDQELLSARRDVRHVGDELRDFADTAALIELMDVVVTVDTSVAHLAGAMGKPVWLLLAYNRDWRWLLDRDDSPWYPTARLFRQKRIGDWDSVVARVRNELAGIIFPPA